MSDQNQNQGRGLKSPADATQRRGTAENIILMVVYTAVILFALVIPAVQVLTRFFQILFAPETAEVIAEMKANGEPLIDPSSVKVLGYLGVFLLFMTLPSILAIVNLVSVIKRQINYARCGSEQYMTNLLDGQAGEQSTQTLRRIADELNLVAVACPNCGDKVITAPDSRPKCPSCMERFNAATAQRISAAVLDNPAAPSEATAQEDRSDKAAVSQQPVAASGAVPPQGAPVQVPMPAGSFTSNPIPAPDGGVASGGHTVPRPGGPAMPSVPLPPRP